MAYTITGKDGMAALWTLTVKDGKAERFDAVVSPWTSTSGTLPGAVFSPDGKWVAYAAGQALNRLAVYVQPVPPTGTKYQISKNEDLAHHPVWSPDGKELFFLASVPVRLQVVRIATQPTFSFGEAVALALPTVGLLAGAPWFERPYDTSRDGQRFLSVIDATQGAQSGKPEAPQIRAVLNWQEELKQLVPTR